MSLVSKPGFLLVAQREFRWLFRDRVALLLIFGVPLFAFIVLTTVFSHPVIRGLGVTDPEVSPNHAWRRTFKAIGFRCGIPEKVIDAIVGHAPASVGRAYGEPTLADKAAALSKFPRYRV